MCDLCLSFVFVSTLEMVIFTAHISHRNHPMKLLYFMLLWWKEYNGSSSCRKFNSAKRQGWKFRANQIAKRNISLESHNHRIRVHSILHTPIPVYAHLFLRTHRSCLKTRIISLVVRSDQRHSRWDDYCRLQPAARSPQTSVARRTRWLAECDAYQSGS